MGLLEAREVAKEFPGAGQVLRGVNLTLESGARAAIVGPSGCGKSTLLNILGTLEAPDSGEVRLSGESLSGRTETDLAKIRRERLGWVFQLHHLLPQCTALENTLIPTLSAPLSRPRREPAEVRAKRLLTRVGLSGREGHFPAQLSGGERQRVAVVRALINEPEILLADEPTGALDAAAADALADLLLELNQEEGVALLVITHAPELATRLGTTWRLIEGKLQA
ncbi:MAG: ABC transporter ATP-binding protein [Armatimonas sp.]